MALAIILPNRKKLNRAIDLWHSQNSITSYNELAKAARNRRNTPNFAELNSTKGKESGLAKFSQKQIIQLALSQS